MLGAVFARDKNGSKRKAEGTKIWEALAGV
jgi:hypothetical protein